LLLSNPIEKSDLDARRFAFSSAAIVTLVANLPIATGAGIRKGLRRRLALKE
jgi:hypothetical protein